MVSLKFSKQNYKDSEFDLLKMFEIFWFPLNYRKSYTLTRIVPTFPLIYVALHSCLPQLFSLAISFVSPSLVSFSAFCSILSSSVSPNHVEPNTLASSKACSTHIWLAFTLHGRYPPRRSRNMFVTKFFKMQRYKNTFRKCNLKWNTRVWFFKFKTPHIFIFPKAP